MEKEIRKMIVHKSLDNPNWSGRKIAKILNIPKSTVNNVLKRYKQTLSIERKTRAAKKKGSGDPALRVKVLRSIRLNPGLSDNDRAKRYGTSKSTVRRIRKNAKLVSYRTIKFPNRSEKQQSVAKRRARILYEQVLTKFNGCIIMDDETYVKMDVKQLPGRNFYVAKIRGGVAERYKYDKLDKFGKKVLVWQAICSCGLKSRPFVTHSTMSGELYRQECLEKRLLPFIRCHQAPVKFWPDLASCHYSKDTMDWYCLHAVDIIPKHMNPPNCPELRPIERFWAITKQKLKKHGKTSNSKQNLGIKWNKVCGEVSRQVVQNLMQGIKKKVRNFYRNIVI